MRAEKHFFLREALSPWADLVGHRGGGLPFYFSGYFESFVDCIFETCSGFTTTGATILVDIEALPRGSCSGAPSPTGWAAWVCWCWPRRSSPLGCHPTT